MSTITAFELMTMTESQISEYDKTVRIFSPIGPCVSRGRLVRETSQFYVFHDRYEECEKRIAKRGRAHIEPCARCEDHPHTDYPDGYQDWGT